MLEFITKNSTHIPTSKWGAITINEKQFKTSVNE